MEDVENDYDTDEERGSDPLFARIFIYDNYPGGIGLSEPLYRLHDRLVRECEALGEYAIAEDIREILRQEQEHQIDLATALGEDVPDVSRPR